MAPGAANGHAMPRTSLTRSSGKSLSITAGGAVAIGDATSPLIMQNAPPPCELVQREHGTLCGKGVAELQDAAMFACQAAAQSPDPHSV